MKPTVTVLSCTHLTRQQQYDRAVALQAQYPNIKVKNLDQYPEHKYEFDLSIPRYEGETFPVEINFQHVDTHEGVNYYDTDVKAHNNDNASLREQQAGINAAIEYFYAHGFNTAHGILIGEQVEA